MATLATTMALGGSILQAAGASAEGRSQQAAANFQAAQLEAQGRAEYASATKRAQEEMRQGDLMASRARAVAAASGGGQDIPLMGQIEEDKALRAGVALYEGEEALKGRATQAQASRYDGQQYRRAGNIRAASTILSGGASFLENYG